MAATFTSDAAAAFTAAVEGLNGCQPRKMFGYPAACVHGNMFAGLHRDGLVLRLDADAREAAIARAGAKPFTAMGGRVMREWVIAPPSLLATDAELRHWIAKAFEHAAALPPKTARQSGQAEATSRRRRRSPGR